jgi:nitrogen-specific signal transduction histidine kinase/pSer/pThr/pTyr-binding forkhead associated (FHA) protein
MLRLERRSYIVGRALACDIIIPDNRVTRRHCQITYIPERGVFSLRDLGSTQGTFLNGQKVLEPQLLAQGSEIAFGQNSEFRIKFVGSETQPLVDQKVDSEEQRRVTSQFEISKLKSIADPQRIKKELTSAGALKDQAVPDDLAQRFYDLTVKMSLAIYPQQEFQILSDHLFECTTADRLLVIRLHQDHSGESESQSGRESDVSQYQYSMEYSAIRSDAPEAVQKIGDKFSRSMIARAAARNQAILYSREMDSTQFAAQGHANSSICAPLMGHDHLLGCLYLDIHDDRSAAFSEADLRFIGMVAFFFSIYLEREKALESKRETERLTTAGLAVFGAAHYLKNILTAMNGSRRVIETLLKNKDYDAIPETWNVLGRSVDRITESVRLMLDFAREEHPQSEIEDAFVIFGEAAERTRNRAEAAGIEYIVDIPASGAMIHCDPQRIDDVLVNLITNAIEVFEFASESGNQGQAIYLRAGIRGDSEVVCEVSDTGPGIPPEVQTRLFDLFYTTKGSKGSGLGLALSKKIISAHNGKITLRTSSEGTSFYVTLPLTQDDPPSYDKDKRSDPERRG